MGEEAARQVAADLAVWRPDVVFHCAESINAAAEHVYRVTRAVAEAVYKRTTARSYVAVELQSKDNKKKREQLERLLTRFDVPRDGSKAALMHMLLAAGGSADEAYAVGCKFGSLQGLLEAVERDGASSTQAAMARLPLPASTRLVGQAAAEKVVQLVAPGG
ncbi:hypothetical protein C2E21_7755 [Chlorella sorokiniana]|uniref:Uncharacterized protein n=1 Tax=Chlorella sorokiniana TaxID=3076 RepID=A0A2P6TGI4_CHLSO|nr:hypothetical protein C2E21_7755 [Chlorella sorokiniana]|eukprot:PRW33228.1 hypothetical protein C2E21_7755 [Chlorella sorokiniana]